MKVAMYYSNSDIRLQEMLRPKAGRGEILMRAEANGICGSDVMEWYRKDKAPLVLGHETAGVIEEVGEGVKGYKIGDRIVAAHHVPCGECYYCVTGHETCCDTLRKTNFVPGGFAEFVLLPEINVIKGVFLIPDNLSFEEATFTEPLACVLRAQRVAGIKEGQTVLVIGSGISGQLHIKLARALGAGRLIATDVVPFRLAAGKTCGADFVIHSKNYSPIYMREVNEGRLADLVILCTGAVSAINQALASVERGGTILFFAPTAQGVTIPISINELFFRNDITFTTSYAGAPCDYKSALELISQGRVKVKDLITHRLVFDEIAKGFQIVADARDSIKVIVTRGYE